MTIIDLINLTQSRPLIATRLGATQCRLGQPIRLR
jgi:hypothetical protein